MEAILDVSDAESREGIRVLRHPTRSEIRAAFARLDEEDIKDRWDQYKRGVTVSIEPYDEPDLEIVHSSNIRVTCGYHPHCTCSSNRFGIRRISEDWHTNFMGYNQRQNCYVFSAHRYLLDRFLELSAPLFTEGKIRKGIVRPQQPRERLKGLNEGLGYDQFVMRIEVLDCVLFLTSEQHDPLQLDALVEQEELLANQVHVSGSEVLLNYNGFKGAEDEKTAGYVPNTGAVPEAKTAGDVPSARTPVPAAAVKSPSTSRYSLRDRTALVRYT